jgi:hypothetical protein
MSSLYLGHISAGDSVYQIHAFTRGLPFREFPSSEISDSSLFDAMLKGRYDVLASGREIRWGGIDKEKQQEYNPHDDRPGTLHIAALDQKDQKMACVISIAVDTGEKEQGDIIGLPLENRWKKNEKQKSSSLDRFRENYLSFNYGVKRPIEPYEMAELYRHYRVSDIDANIPRIAICTGAFHLLIKEARNRNRTETFLWVFDAIVPYFNLYRIAGAAVLRSFTLKDPPRYISPSPDKIVYKRESDQVNAYWGEEIISHSVKVPQLHIENGNITYKTEEIIYLDGIVDLHRVEKAMIESPIELLPLKNEGMTEEDMQMLRAAVSVVGRRGYEEYHRNNPKVMSVINQYSKFLGIKSEFNEIGGPQSTGNSKQNFSA